MNSAIAKASAGNILTLPDGNYTWVGQVFCNKGITLRALNAPDQSNDDWKVKIINGMPNGQVKCLAISAPATGRVRLSGLSFDGRNVTDCVSITGAAGRQARVDNCRFTGAVRQALVTYYRGPILIDHCYFVDNVYVTCSTYSDVDQDGAWAEGTTLGTINTVAYEDCRYHYTATGARLTTSPLTWDAGHGAKRLIRYCTWTSDKPKNSVNASLGLAFWQVQDFHGNGKCWLDAASGNIQQFYGKLRGAVQVEMMHNHFKERAGVTVNWFDNRGGTFVCFDNDFDGAFAGNYFRMREEDGTNAGLMGSFSYGNDAWTGQTIYPGVDKHLSYYSNNRKNGAATLTSMANIGFAYRGATSPGTARTLWDTCRVTAGSTTISDSSGSFMSTDIGKAVNGSGIPAGTTITAVASSTSATMSKAAMGSRAAANLGAAIGSRTHYIVAIGVREDAFFIQAGRDVFFAQKPGYTELVYPHPFITDGR